MIWCKILNDSEWYSINENQKWKRWKEDNRAGYDQQVAWLINQWRNIYFKSVAHGNVLIIKSYIRES